MTEHEQAEQLITDFAVYDWNEKTGYEQNMEQSKKQAIKCVDLILSLSLCEDCNEAVERYWTEVKLELTK